jgi:hypothetical protein
MDYDYDVLDTGIHAAVSRTAICSHQWINPNDPPIQRAPYSPWIGPHRREMKSGTLYRCNNCDAVLKIGTGVRHDD